jgi:hypothetical protein
MVISITAGGVLIVRSCMSRGGLSLINERHIPTHRVKNDQVINIKGMAMI